MHDTYVEAFNEASGHFHHLLESVRREGFRNPVMLSAGKLLVRLEEEIPPLFRGKGKPVCEYLGGSRIWAAAHLNLRVPCIVNDFGNAFPEAEPIVGMEELLKRFTDRPARAEMLPSGAARINNLPFMHLPPERRYSMSRQIRLRRGVVTKVQRAVQAWLRKNDV